jgi:Zn-dependent M28 family amino/carboxypeptidase
MKKNFIVFVLALLLALPSLGLGQAEAAKANSQARKAAEGVSAAQLKDYLYFIASDEMEGRDTPSRGLNTTAKFIATQLSRWAVKPAGDDGTYFQKITLRGTSPDASKASVELSGQQFTLGDDFIRLSGMAATLVTAPLVYGGSGWMIKSKNIDTLQGADVKGKIVVIYSSGAPSVFSLASLPAGVSPQDLTGQRNVDWADPIVNARLKGAAGVIVIASGFAQDHWGDLRDFYARPNYSVEKFPARSGGGGGGGGQFNASPAILVSPKMASAIFAGEANNPMTSGSEAAAFSLSANKNLTISIPMKTETGMTQNVVGLIEGSDATLKNEIVAVGAHYDHIGLSRPSTSDDRINNGADDDGSGTVSILSIAEALAKSPKKPKRSVLFVWHCGEEKGLWGSEYFNKFPTVDIKKVVAQLNIDMIGRSRKADDANPKNKDLSGENEVYVIGSEMMSSTLGSIVKGINSAYLNLNYDTKYDDPKDPNRFFFRSDHFNYAVNGIPITFWFDGVHEDYHQPGDEPQKIDYVKMEKIARTIFLTMWEVADLKDRPAVDKELPKELQRRN